MKIDDFLSYRTIKCSPNDIIFAGYIGGEPVNHHWCQMPYHDHPKGCPNYGKSELCPPKIRRADSLLLKYSFSAIFVAEFDFLNYKKQRAAEHPEWTERQVACCLYYQPAVKSRFSKYVEQYIQKDSLIYGCGSGFVINNRQVPSMESVGIDVFTTMKRLAHPLTRNPTKKVQFIALICTNNKIKKSIQSRLL